MDITFILTVTKIASSDNNARIYDVKILKTDFMKDIVIMLVKLFLILGDIELLLVLSTFRLWETGECNKFIRIYR